MGTHVLNDQIGSIFAGRYELRKLLGDGGMGKVYLAADQMLDGELVALKVLHPALSADSRYSQRFLREVQVTRRITHPNIVRTYDIGTTDGDIFFTMEYAEGSTLKDKLAAGRIPADDLCDILDQICQGLSLIHAEGVVHRDLKPGNVILTPEGIVKLTDFGIARTGLSEITSHNEVVGSAAYMAPEAWLGKIIDARTDIYALGIMSYELLTGNLPFDAESPPQMMGMHLQETPPPVKEKAPNTPPWLVAVVERMIAKDPNDRPQSVEDLRHQIALGLDPERLAQGTFEAPPESLILRGAQITDDNCGPKTAVRAPASRTSGRSLRSSLTRAAAKIRRWSRSTPAPTTNQADAKPTVWLTLLGKIGGLVVSFCLSWIIVFGADFLLRYIRVEVTADSLAYIVIGAIAAALASTSLLAALPLLFVFTLLLDQRTAIRCWLRIAAAILAISLVLYGSDVWRLHALRDPEASEHKAGPFSQISSTALLAVQPRVIQVVESGMLIQGGTRFKAIVWFKSPAFTKVSEKSTLPPFENWLLVVTMLTAASLLLARYTTAVRRSQYLRLIKLQFKAALCLLGLSWMIINHAPTMIPAAALVDLDLTLAGLPLRVHWFGIASAAIGWVSFICCFLYWRSAAVRQAAPTTRSSKQ